VLAISLFLDVRALVALTVGVVADVQGRSALRLYTKWDAQWYAGIAENGYGFVRQHEDGRLLADYAFFPLYPAAERFVSAITGLAYPIAGVLLSVLASVVAAGGIFAVADRVLGARAAVVAVVLWGVLPVAVVQTMAYSESLFTALAAWCLYAVLCNRWLLAAFLACGAGLTRPAGAAVVVAVVVAAVVARVDAPESIRARGVRRLLDRRLAAVLIAPLGLLGYLGWVAYETGDLDGYVTVTQRWGNGFDGGHAFGTWIVGHLVGTTPLVGLAILVGLAALVGLLVLCIRQRLPPPVLIYTVALVALALTTSGYFGSKPRYLLPAFPLLFPVARWLAGRPRWVIGTGLAAAAVGSAAYAAVWLLGPGPP
jgi:hypothetical protein